MMLIAAICAIFGISIYRGWKKGFILGVTDLLAWAGTILLAVSGFLVISRLLETYFVERLWAVTGALLLTVLVVRFFVQYVINAIISSFPPSMHRAKLNRFLGLLTGLAAGSIYSVLLLFFVLILPFPEAYTTTVRNNRVGAVLIEKIHDLQALLGPDALRIEPSDKTIDKLPFRVTNAVRRPDLEAQMLALVNSERAKAGLKPVKADPELAEVAVRHSADMFSRSYFSHYTPEGKDPFWRMRQRNIRFITAGENLALAPTLETAHTGLMKSPGHRANILRPAFGRLGIGILDGGVRGLMVTQNFRN